ncbi:MAG TPA: alpha/beta family hydrolase [Gemmatimonadales bacterium]|nr:alpha/beta family hydrolase [Gemmatimonadales bacterium]
MHPDEPLTLMVGSRTVSGLLCRPTGARALLVLGHGAGAGMRHHFMADVSAALADRAVATLRYQFPYMEEGRGRPDPPGLLQATVRAACETADRLAPELPRFAGGKSLGGRMTSSAQAEVPLPGVRGLVFFGFPLHPPKRPGTSRAEHLGRIAIPMLFLQGTRDDLADLDLIRGVLAPLPTATLHVVDGANHSFEVLKRSGRTAAMVLAELADTVVAWFTPLA